MTVALPLSAAEPGIKIEDPWVRVTFGQSRATAGYMALVDQSGKGNTLVALEMADGAKAEIHETVTEGDIVKMRMVKSVPIPAGGRAELTPAGGHIMIMGLKAPLKVGETVPMKLKFADGSEMMAYFAVRTN
ncbi:MAG: copper chaperone PCu(A)C [Rhodospirillaceae bacterium]